LSISAPTVYCSPKKITLLWFPPLSWLSSSCKGWCESATRRTMNFKSSCLGSVPLSFSKAANRAICAVARCRSGSRGPDQSRSQRNAIMQAPRSRHNRPPARHQVGRARRGSSTWHLTGRALRGSNPLVVRSRFLLIDNLQRNWFQEKSSSTIRLTKMRQDQRTITLRNATPYRKPLKRRILIPFSCNRLKTSGKVMRSEVN